jgi:hypothetical protein
MASVPASRRAAHAAIHQKPTPRSIARSVGKLADKLIS